MVLAVVLGCAPLPGLLQRAGAQADGGVIDSTRERARVLAAADRYLKERPVTVTAVASPRSAGGRARLLFRRRLLVAGSGESGRALHPEGRHDQSGQLQRSPPRDDAAVGAGAGAGRRLRADQRRSVRAARRASRARLVHLDGDADEPRPCTTRRRSTAASPGAAPASSTPSTWSKSRARSNCSTALRAGRTTSAHRSRQWFDGLPRLADDDQVRNRRARRQEQPRDLLGDAGGGVRAAHRRRAAACATAATASRRSCCSRWRPTAAFRASCAAPSPTATRSSTSMRWRRSARSSRPRRTICGRSSCPTAAACEAPWPTWPRSSATRSPGRSRPT